MSAKRTPAQPSASERPSTEAQFHQGTWPAAARQSILTAYESYPKGDPRRGELLRRHGLYTSHMSK